MPSEKLPFSYAHKAKNATLIKLSDTDALPFLRSGEIVGGQRIPRGSNYTFLIWIAAGTGKYLPAVYKPRNGERPLHDFPQGTLYKREYAAFVLSSALGWPNVPPTLVREGPHGIGAVQLYIHFDPQVTYFELINEREEELMAFAVFDLLINNADRKAGHCLLGEDGRVWSIDHGLTFHPIFKLRTVMLEFWDRAIPQPLLTDLELIYIRLKSGGDLLAQMEDLLSSHETRALQKRLEAMLENPVLPTLDPYLNVPWPWV